MDAAEVMGTAGEEGKAEAVAAVAMEVGLEEVAQEVQAVVSVVLAVKAEAVAVSGD